MNATILALSGYIGWLMILLLVLAFYRSFYNQKNKRKELKFSADGTDLDELGYRITRAHLNMVESFPFIAGTMLLAIASDATAITNGLAYVLLAARLVQTCIHLASISNTAVTLRFVFFLIQFGIVAYWLFKLLMRFL